GSSAFKGCSGLTSVTIPNSVTSIGRSAFDGCTGLTSVTYNAANCSGPSDADYAWFKDCPLTKIVIGDAVKTIPAYLAYGQNKLTSVTIPGSVTDIEAEAFSGCTSLSSLTIPSSVSYIGAEAFIGCTSLTSLTFNAKNCCSSSPYEPWFKNCPLTKIVIGNAVKTIPAYLAYGCTGLTSVTIPKSVTSIGSSAFNSSNIRDIYAAFNDPIDISDDVFHSKCYSNAILHVPAGRDRYYKARDVWKTFQNIWDDYVVNDKPGDINGDSNVNVGDVTALVNSILGGGTFDETLCDVNGDGVVNVTDVTAIINIILGN
ncbi:MAG: leucine-rich repeat protein, partial [Bacteroidales bacterium]|nr:leucine-rich repeat protein [Bacteroidales bacterium]